MMSSTYKDKYVKDRQYQDDDPRKPKKEVYNKQKERRANKIDWATFVGDDE